MFVCTKCGSRFSANDGFSDPPALCLDCFEHQSGKAAVDPPVDQPPIDEHEENESPSSTRVNADSTKGRRRMAGPYEEMKNGKPRWRVHEFDENGERVKRTFYDKTKATSYMQLGSISTVTRIRITGIDAHGNERKISEFDVLDRDEERWMECVVGDNEYVLLITRKPSESTNHDLQKQAVKYDASPGDGAPF